MKKQEFEVRLFKALAHPIRLEIVNKLLAGSLCVCELFDDSEFSQPNTSQHLKILRDAGVLDSAKEGSRIIYSIRHPEIKKLVSLSGEIVTLELKKLLEE